MSDYIDRDAAIEAVNGMPDCPNGYSDTYDKAHIIAVLEDMPSVQPEKTQLSEEDATKDAINDFLVGFIYGAYVRGTE